MRLVVMGNSGSGKTTFARALASATGLPLVSLDTIFWEPGGFDHTRPEYEQHRLLDASCAGDAWVVEGVFGKLISRVLPRSSCLVWLDLPLEDCLEGLHRRHVDLAISLPKHLLEWVSDYETRDGSNCRAAHRLLYDSFAEDARHIVASREEIKPLIEKLSFARPRGKE